ncbi:MULTISPECIES: glutaminase B [Pseudoalteromonas]|uniref:Glutaminase n=2 Tax=Pseudoalteromonas TaxID=53246 RepID=A0A2K4XC14_PSEVC|nr:MULTISPECIES: glutaminase B [Pseudoalteromonas]KTF12956.1 glutaminase A [Pseudoalteromonas sp. H103]MBE0383508.1 glutaminase [Pseudoalteromonas carrageenovora IAM 12662]MDO6465249.1 glutaminase B [Pseudoalteromonas carrageenovora]MDO6547845.1 glutaminase B [Pseudoalteromonas carrageenovora]MDO6832298.1 glutaminase B [Pseudoalteromonas carrageenovora]
MPTADYQKVLDEIAHEVRPLLSQGKVADYIPALAEVDPEQFSIAIYTTNGETICAGDCSKRFTIQSVSKVMTLTMALQRYGDELWHRVGKEPSGTAFNSLTQLEFEKGIPRNPFINAGAIVTCDALYSRLSAPRHSMLETFRLLSGNSTIVIDKKVANSEYEFRHRNAAMAHLMKSFGNFENDVDDVLWSYFNFCSIELNCVELAKAYNFLANKGIDFSSGKRVLSSRQNKQLNSLLFTSGLYDAAGDFGYRVGMPGKSGVSGTILAVLPGKFTVAVYSPGLNSFGNSVAGIAALELLSKKLDISIF